MELGRESEHAFPLVHLLEMPPDALAVTEVDMVVTRSPSPGGGVGKKSSRQPGVPRPGLVSPHVRRIAHDVQVGSRPAEFADRRAGERARSRILPDIARIVGVPDPPDRETVDPFRRDGGDRNVVPDIDHLVPSLDPERVIDVETPPVASGDGVVALVEVVGSRLSEDAPVSDLAEGELPFDELGPLRVEKRVAVGEADRGVETQNERGVQFFIPPAEIRVDDPDPEKDPPPIPVPDSEDGIGEDVPPLADLDHEMGEPIS